MTLLILKNGMLDVKIHSKTQKCWFLRPKEAVRGHTASIFFFFFTFLEATPQIKTSQ